MRFVLFLLLMPIWPAWSALNIFACEPEWGALASSWAAEKANVYAATTALQDPHRIEARPSLIARARRADLVVCTGAELEVGWLPLLQTQSGNPKIQPGQPGYFEAARDGAAPRAPGELDRALGDVHPEGNPHIHLDPRNIERVAAALAERMAQLDPGQAAHYRERSQVVPRPLARGDRALGEAGGAAQGHAARRLPQGPRLPEQLARHAGGRRAGAQARAAAEHRAPH